MKKPLTDKELGLMAVHAESIADKAKNNEIYEYAVLYAAAKLIENKYKDEHLANDLRECVSING